MSLEKYCSILDMLFSIMYVEKRLLTYCAIITFAIFDVDSEKSWSFCFTHLASIRLNISLNMDPLFRS